MGDRKSLQTLPDRLRTVADLLSQAAYAVEVARLERNTARASHEGQRRNTMAFMHERDEAYAALAEIRDRAPRDIQEIAERVIGKKEPKA